jgi:hypothetical protein
LRAFGEATRRLRTEIPEFLATLTRAGRTVAGYGAAAKGVVLANYCGIDAKLLPFVADRSPHKQGKWMPGVHIPVVAPEVVNEKRPDHLIVFAWNFFDEIAGQLEGYQRSGGGFILPLPKPRIALPHGS